MPQKKLPLVAATADQTSDSPSRRAEKTEALGEGACFQSWPTQRDSALLPEQPLEGPSALLPLSVPIDSPESPLPGGYSQRRPSVPKTNTWAQAPLFSPPSLTSLTSTPLKQTADPSAPLKPAPHSLLSWVTQSLSNPPPMNTEDTSLAKGSAVAPSLPAASPSSKDISNASDEPPKNIWSVSQLSTFLRHHIEDTFSKVSVQGEISGLKKHSSGHIYFALKDEKAVIDAVCWKAVAQKVALFPQEGDHVNCLGQVTTYAGRSKYQLVISSIEKEGTGSWLQRLEALKTQLREEGLCHRKRPLPFLPKNLGIITSPTGAVIQDMLHRIRGRFPCGVCVWPVLVQGSGCSEQMIQAIQGFNDVSKIWRTEEFCTQTQEWKSCVTPFPTPDILIVARGGGSLEDLQGFNDESLARAIFHSRIPVVTAVGHETDTTLVDYVSDLRAPTPTASIELLLPQKEDLHSSLHQYEQRLYRTVHHCMHLPRLRLEALDKALRQIDGHWQRRAQMLDYFEEKLHKSVNELWQRCRHQLHMVTKTFGYWNPWKQQERHQKDVHMYTERLQRAAQKRVCQWQERLRHQQTVLQALSYKRTLERGFAMVTVPAPKNSSHPRMPLMRAQDIHAWLAGMPTAENMALEPDSPCLEVHFADGTVPMIPLKKPSGPAT